MPEQQIYTSQISGGANLNPNSAPYQNFVPPVSAFEGNGKGIADAITNLGKPAINIYDQMQDEQAKAWTQNKLKEVQLSYQDKFANKEIQTKDGFDKTWQETSRSIDEQIPNARAQKMIKSHLDSLQLGYRQDAINIQNKLAAQSITAEKVGFMDKTLQQMVDPKTPIEDIERLGQEASLVGRQQANGLLAPADMLLLESKARTITKTAYKTRAAYPDDANQILNHVDTDGVISGLTWAESQDVVQTARYTIASTQLNGALPNEMPQILAGHAPDHSDKMPLEMQQQNFENLQRQAQKQMSDFSKDPVAYIESGKASQSKMAMYSAHQEYARMAANLNNPQSTEDQKEEAEAAKANWEKMRDGHFNELTKIQDQAGIPRYEQTIISEKKAQEIEKGLYNVTSQGNSAKATVYLQNLQDAYGEQYGQMLGSLKIDSKTAIATSAVGSTELQPFLDYTFSTRDKKGGQGKDYSTNISKENSDLIKGDISKGFSEYKKSLLNQSPLNIDLVTNQEKELNSYASYLVDLGVAPKDASRRAINLVKNSHTVIEASSGSNPTLVPNKYAPNEREAIKGNLSVLFDDLTSEDRFKNGDKSMLSLSKYDPSKPENERLIREELNDYRKNGFWSMMPNQSGVVFMSRNKDGTPFVVTNKEGKTFSIGYDELKEVKKEVSTNEGHRFSLPDLFSSKSKEFNGYTQDQFTNPARELGATLAKARKDKNPIYGVGLALGGASFLLEKGAQGVGRIAAEGQAGTANSNVQNLVNYFKANPQSLKELPEKKRIAMQKLIEGK